MNPVLLNNLISTFCEQLEVVYLWELNAYKDYGKWLTKDESFLPKTLETSVLDKTTKDFIKVNSLSLHEKHIFYETVRRYVKKYFDNVLQLKPVTVAGFPDDIYESLVDFKKRMNDCISYLDYEIEQIKFEQDVDVQLEEMNYRLEKNASKQLDSIHENAPPYVKESTNIETLGLSWKNKTELSELIFVLFHSKRILKNGLPIQQKDLTMIVNKLFSMDIKEPSDLLGKTTRTYKRGEDRQTFIKELNGYLEKYHDKKRIKQ